MNSPGDDEINERAREILNANGITDDAPDTPGADAVDALLGKLLSTEDLDKIPMLQPLIADMLFLDSLGRINGPSGHGKSFVSLDMAGSVGTGLPWHGRRVHKGPVVYIVAEGARGVRKRVRAWEQTRCHRMDDVWFLPEPVQAMSPDWFVLIEACRRIRPVFVVIDTQARVTVGVEENSATEMGRIIHRMEELRAATGACVLLIHHKGLNGDHGRGSTAVKGAMQTELTVTKDGKGADAKVTVATDKQKDSEEIGKLVFALRQVKLDGEAEDDGRPVTSAVLESDVPTASRGLIPGSVEDIAAKLDAAGVPRDWGRDRLRTSCASLGLKVSNRVLGEVASFRKHAEQVESLSAHLSYSPVTEPVPDIGTGEDITAGQTCPGQVQDSSGQAEADLSVPSLPLGRGQGGQPGPECVICGHPLDADWARRGYDRHVTC